MLSGDYSCLSVFILGELICCLKLKKEGKARALGTCFWGVSNKTYNAFREKLTV